MNAIRKLASDYRAMNGHERRTCNFGAVIILIVTVVAALRLSFVTGALAFTSFSFFVVIVSVVRYAACCRHGMDEAYAILREVAPDSPVWERLDAREDLQR